MSSNSPKDTGASGAGKSSASSDSASARPVLRAPSKPAKPAPTRGAGPREGGRDAGRSSDGRGPRGPRDGSRDGARFERSDRGDRDFRGSRDSRGEGRDNRDHRPVRDDRPPVRSSGFGRPDQGRPGQGRDHRPVREDGERRGGFGQRDGQPRDRFDRSDRPNSDRPRFERNDRPSSDRPRFDREGQGARSFGGGDRGFRPYGEHRDGERSERPRFDREDRPQRSADRGFGRADGERGGERGNYGGDRREGGRDNRDFRRDGDRPAPRRDDRGPRPEGRGFGRADGDRGDRRPAGPRSAGPRDGAPRDFRRDERQNERRDDRRQGGAGRPEGRSFDRDDRGFRGGRDERQAGSREQRGDNRSGGRDERDGKPHIPGSFVSEATRRPTTGIRTYRPAADGSDRAIPVKRAEVQVNQDDRPGAVRINKRMADEGMCSRREADEWVDNGWVRVNGEVAVMGQMVVPADKITVDQQAQDRQNQLVTILMHKPMGYVSGQAEDGHEPAAVLFTNENRWNEDRSKTRFNFSQLKGLAPCGRLDIDSVGLLVLTQDGRVARQIIGEDSEVDKEYLVRVTMGDRDIDVQSVFPEEKLALLRHGLELDGEPLQPAKVDWQNPEQLRFVLTEGKKRQIRRMCEQVGLRVVGLKRIRIGRVTLGNLPVGQWRYLAASESF